MNWKYFLLVTTIFGFALTIVFFVDKYIFNKDEKEQLSISQYHASQIGPTLKYGRIVCVFGVFILLFYIYMEYTVLNMKVLALIRLLPLSLMIIFLIGSFTFLIKKSNLVIPSYTAIILGCLINIGALLFETALNPNNDLFFQVGGLLGTILYWTCLALVAFGSSKYFASISAVWLIMIISLYIVLPYKSDLLLFFPVIVIVIIANVLVIQRDRINYDKYTIYKSLQKRESELKQKHIEIHHQNEQLLRSNQLLEHFAEQVSHDLKEPLKTIKNFGIVLKKKYGEGLDDNYSKYLDLMSSSSERMDNLIQGLLNFSKVKGQEFKSDKIVDLNKVVSDVTLNLQATIDAKSANIISEDLPVIKAQHSLMVQVFQNIIANSIKFQPEGQVPIVSVESRYHPTYYHIAIKDNGIGIDKAHVNEIFNTFTRLNPQSQYEGSGIGLSTCHAIITGYGGHINVDSTKGIGTTFNLYFPKQ